MDLNQTWFILLGALLTGYAVLDGFDLGVGILHLAVAKGDERRLVLNAIGPLWDGNEVWLVTFGGALFAAFPNAYAAAFSSFYLPFMLLMFCLVFRAVSIEFRSKRPSTRWRSAWDGIFSLSSLTASVLYGVAVGNSLQGIPIGADGEFLGSLPDLLRPYPLLVGAFTAAVFAMHGAIYLYLKTEGALQRRLKLWMWRCFGVFLALYMLTTIVTLVSIPHATARFQSDPWAWGVVVVSVLAIANIPRAIYLERPFYAFLSSGASIASLTTLFGWGLYPNLVSSSLDPAWSLDIYDAASSHGTLRIMLGIALLGMPFVLSYTAIVYWVFRGKVKLGSFSY